MSMKAVVALVLVGFLGPAWGVRKKGIQARAQEKARTSTDAETHVQKDTQDARNTTDTELQSNCVQLCSMAYVNDNSLDYSHKSQVGRRNWIEMCVRQKQETGQCITTIFALPPGQSCASICPRKVQDKTSSMYGMDPIDCWSYCKNRVTSSNSGYSGGAGYPNTAGYPSSAYPSPAYPGGSAGGAGYPNTAGYPNSAYPNPAYPGGASYPVEMRYASDGRAYTYSQFVQYYGNNAASLWAGAKPEMRYAEDGRAYTYSQFAQWYPQNAARYWDAAKRA